MKKFSLLLAIALVLAIAVPAFAGDMQDSRYRIVTGTATSAGALTTLSDGSTFSVANDVVIGYTVAGTGNCLVGIYDTATASLAVAATLVAELENIVTYAPQPTVWLPYPITFKTGIYIRFADSGTNLVTVYVVKNWTRIQ